MSRADGPNLVVRSTTCTWRVYDAGMRDASPDRRLRADDPRLDAWRAFLVAHARLSRRLDEELRAEHDLSLAEYDALVQLAQAPDRRLRMSRLASLVLLSKSGVTRLIDRLEADGFVERNQCLHDARGAEATLTRAGLDKLREAAVTHLAGIDRYFLATLPEADLAAIERGLTAVARMAGGEPDPAADEPVTVAEPDRALAPAG
jgi:DNA-binding MarR family transcriptional regulator